MKTTRPPAEQISVRVDDAIIARIDALLPFFSEPARDSTRSDVLRAAILLGLDNFERDPDGAKRELARIDKMETPPE